MKRYTTLFLLLAVLFGCSKREDTAMLPPGYPPQPDSYPLPATDISDDVRAKLNPWVAGFIGLSPQQATARLQKRWESIESKPLLGLRSVLGEFEVREIVDYGDGGLIYAVRPNAEDQNVGNAFYLPAPIDAELLASRLNDSNLSDVDNLPEFMTHFGGLAEDTTTAGQFVHTENPWPTFTDSWDGSIEGFDEWKDSLMLYHARNGCILLVRSDGHVAWWVMQEAVVREIAQSFGEFIEPIRRPP